ncbi:uncharacterized protein DS421_14g467330 [Arachis hypogaea]|nr:uncharacterized protein DS421_14g467330 [Arachis hypogaea]
MKKALKGNPWLFRNFWLIVKQYERNIDPEHMNFSQVKVKIQIWNLPEHCKTVKFGKKLTNLVRELRDCSLFEGGSGQEKFIKALVMMKIDQLVRKGANIGSAVDGITWVDFRYEMLPTLCYFCGFIGHDENLCEKVDEEKAWNQRKSKELGASRDNGYKGERYKYRGGNIRRSSEGRKRPERD